MKYLILSLVLFVGCSNSTAPEQPEIFEPYKIGNWLMTSQSSAKWVGQETTYKTLEFSNDTVNVSSSADWPGEMVLTVWPHGGNKVVLTYTDTSFVMSDYGLHRDRLDVAGMSDWNKDAIKIHAGGFEYADYMIAPMLIEYNNCNKDRMQVDELFIILYDPTPPTNWPYSAYPLIRDDNVYLTYAIQVDGILEAVESLVTCHSY